ncbi:MAG TPA: zinc ABC transporter substrate-binding protein [Arenicellales bacterium]|nr:zinc ABC transporter substrate-binding protein [Arenicellales bacterium]
MTVKLFVLAMAMLFSMCPGSAAAQVPRVATDIAPVHSLTAQVMQGLGVPELIVQRGASPHHYAMRPSEARMVQAADLVISIGAGLTPWLNRRLEVLAGKAQHLELMAVSGTVSLAFREEALFTTDSAETINEAHEAHEAHQEHQEHEAHEAHEEHQEHVHEGIDPHGWLDPVNGQIWLDAIASALSQLDPANAARYSANALAGKEQISQARTRIEQHLKSLQGQDFIVFHDAYQYFEARFEIRSIGAISASDALKPSAARLAQIRAMVLEHGIDCVLTEPQFNSDLLGSIFENTPIQQGVIDSQGLKLDAGPALYVSLLENIARQIAGCVGAGA